jgi:cob(I)alamin adenosyltransferase
MDASSDNISPSAADDANADHANSTSAGDADKVAQLDLLLSHVWMVRAFIKHSEEAEEDDELNQVQRSLYDYMLALGPPLRSGDHAKYLKLAKKKLKKLIAATDLFLEIQPEISSHTNFQMAAMSLKESVGKVATILTASD